MGRNRFALGAVVMLVSGLIHALLSVFMSPALVLVCMVPFYIGALTIYLEADRKRDKDMSDTLKKAAKTIGTLAVLHPGIERVVLDAFDVAIEDLRAIETFAGETDIYVALTRLLNGLTPESVFNAVCFWKTWDSGPLKGYFTANGKAVERGVVIRRVFADGQAEARKEFARQKAAGIITRLISSSRLERMVAELGLPRAMGFSVTKDWVFFHVGLKDNAEGFLIRSEVVARRVQELFERIEANSEEDTPQPENAPAA